MADNMTKAQWDAGAAVASRDVDGVHRPLAVVYGDLNFGGSAVGNLFDNAAAVGMSAATIATVGKSKVLLRTEFDDSGDSVTLRPWFKDSHATTTWTPGSTITLSSTAVGSGSGPGSAACLKGAGWFFGQSAWVDVLGYASVTFEITTAPATEGVSVWGSGV